MIFRFSEYSLDTELHELSGPEGPVSLQPQAFALLVFLIKNTDRVVSKDEIFDSVWQGRIVGDSTLNARINAIRTAVGDDGSRQAVVKTLPRQGFRFVAGVDMSEPQKTHLGKATANSHDFPSIAVVPFANFSDEAEHWYFAHGLSEDINTTLSRISWLRVVPSAVIRSIEDPKSNVLRVAADLQVNWLLTGTARVSGDRVRITAELIDGATGEQRWSERYDQNVVELFELQDTIASTIVSQIQPALTKAEQDRASLDPPENLGAWGHFHRGMAHMFDRGVRENAEHLASALADFNRSIELDPRFSRPYTGRAFCHYYRVVFGYADSRETDLRQGFESARMAVELDPQDAQAYVASAAIQIANREPEQAVRQSRKAIELNPTLSQAHYLLGAATLCAGRPEEAMGYLKVAIDSGPRDQFSAPAFMYRGMACLILGQFDDAVRFAHKSLDLPNGSFWSDIVLTSALGHLGHNEQAKKAKQNLLRRKPDFSRSIFENTSTLVKEDQRSLLLDGLTKAGID